MSCPVAGGGEAGEEALDERERVRQRVGSGDWGGRRVRFRTSGSFFFYGQRGAHVCELWSFQMAIGFGYVRYAYQLYDEMFRLVQPSIE